MKWTKLFLLVFGWLSLVGCLEEEPPLALGYVKFFNLVPDAGDFDLYDNGAKINENEFSYASVSIYVPMVQGSHTVEFRNRVNGTIAKSVNIHVTEDKLYSLFLHGLSSSLEVTYEEDEISLSATRIPVIRVAHFSPDLPNLRFHLSNGTHEYDFTGKFGEFSPFTEFHEGTYSLSLYKTEEIELVMQLENIQLHEGKYYTFILHGFAIPPYENNHWVNLSVIQD